ncbi:hypothetical protein J5751_02425 [bacterium]|nr:hypothetical protein [bacterium]
MLGFQAAIGQFTVNHVTVPTGILLFIVIPSSSNSAVYLVISKAIALKNLTHRPSKFAGTDSFGFISTSQSICVFQLATRNL